MPLLVQGLSVSYRFTYVVTGTPPFSSPRVYYDPLSGRVDVILFYVLTRYVSPVTADSGDLVRSQDVAMLESYFLDLFQVDGWSLCRFSERSRDSRPTLSFQRVLFYFGVPVRLGSEPST